MLVAYPDRLGTDLFLPRFHRSTESMRWVFLPLSRARGMPTQMEAVAKRDLLRVYEVVGRNSGSPIDKEAEPDPTAMSFAQRKSTRLY